MDVKSLLRVDFSQLTEDEKDDIAQSIAKDDLGKFSDDNDLENALKLLHELLRFKVEQVVSLGLELDELALKQGEEEANLLQEIEDLRSQLSKTSQEQNQNGVHTDDDLRQLLHVSELNAQKLLAEVQAQEQEQLSNKMEIEKLESQLAVLESDRLQLKRELSALRDEIQDPQKEIESGIQEPQKKNQQLIESLRQKNKHLSHLLNDIEASEKENIVLREKLTSVKIELAEATKNIMHTTGEIVTLQITKEEQLERIRYLEQMCEALRHQVKELVNEKEKRDAELETFQQEIDVRVSEWKEIVAMKENELSDIREQLTQQNLQGQYIMKDCETEQIALLSHTLQKRESQIDELQSQLSQATKDLNETTSLLENMHRATELSQLRPSLQDAELTHKNILAAEERIRVLEEKLKDAENDAIGKSEEITKLIIQLRSYEAGEFGLAEALAQIKDLSQQRSVRDKHIEHLVETANSLRSTCDCLQEENLTLREKLNISAEVCVPTSATVLKNKEQNVFKMKQQQIDRLEEDLISARMDRRNLTQQVLNLSKKLQDLEGQPREVNRTVNKQQTRLHADARAAARKMRALQQEQHQLSIERQSLIEENEALRQGLHDILDSVHQQDGKSNVRLESKVLEHLLHALDSRHISGWYHPAMRIQAKVNAVEGNNEALREQVHNLREEESKTQTELQKAKLRIAELEGMVKLSMKPEKTKILDDPKLKVDELSTSLRLPEQLSSEGCDLVTKMNNHLLQVLHEHEIEKSQVVETMNIQQELQHHLDELVSQVVQAVEQQSLEKENWHAEKSHLEEKIDAMEAKLSAYEAEIDQLNTLCDTLSAKDESKKITVRDTYDLVKLSAEKKKSERLAEAALRQVNNSKKQLNIIKSEWTSSKQGLLKQLRDLLHFKRNSLLRMSELQLMFLNSVPIASFKAANKQRNEWIMKYNELLRLHEIAESKSAREVKKLMSELEQERGMKDEIARRLEEVSQKLWSRNTGCSMTEEELAAQLARAETDAVRERQHAAHAEKMCEIMKAEVQLVSERCTALEEEVVSLLNANQQLKFFSESSTTGNQTMDKDDLESQLACAKAEVLELQGSRKQLQELADISQSQLQMLDQLHERSELQLDSLRQVLYKLEGESDLGSEFVRLNEELCASQVSEMAAWSQISSLEKQNSEIRVLSESQAKEILELQEKINREKLENMEQHRKMQEEINSLRAQSESTLPLPFFHLVVTAFSQSSIENRDLWHRLQEAKEKLVSQISNTEERKVSCHQSLELQRALEASHSDMNCQRLLEYWASELAEHKMKALKSSRQLEATESALKQTEERLQNQERLLSSLEQQLLSLDIKRLHNTISKERGVIFYENLKEGTKHDETGEILSFLEKEPPNVEDAVNILSHPQQMNKCDPEEIPPKKSVSKKSLIEELLIKEEVKALKEEILHLNECLREKDSELDRCRSVCSDLRASLSQKELLLQNKAAEETLALESTKIKTEKDELNTNVQDRAALQTTVDSLQNIISQKEDTISRYQKFLRDVREEDTRIISALQEHLRIQQADLTAQEQAYVRLKISMRHLTLETNGENSSKSSLDLQLLRSNELEDEVTLLKTKVLTLSSEVQQKQQEASYWRSTAQQHLSTIEELNTRLSELRSTDNRSPFCLTSHEVSLPFSSKSSNLVTPPKKNVQEKQISWKRSRSVEGLSKVRANPMQIHFSAEVTELRNKINLMEQQEQRLKNEIQRLKDQIPIYSRRALQSILPERESELLKKIRDLEQQLEQQNVEHEKALVQRSHQEAKKIKSVENVTRWDERKKHQIHIERLKSLLQEQTDATALLHDKMERMHNTLHRLEREKVTLEHRIKNLHHLEQDKTIWEERSKKLESIEVMQCMLDELRQDRDRLMEELKSVRAKEALANQENKLSTSTILHEMKLERDKMFAEIKALKAKEVTQNKGRAEEPITDSAQVERAHLLKLNLELECENLELKLELEKLQTEAPCLRRRVTHLERLLNEFEKQKQSPTSSMQDPITLENKKLQKMVRQLSEHLEAANHRLMSLEKSSDGNVTALRAELNQKSSLLSKVKILLERAALKERQLTDQVHRLQAELSRK